ncbi:GNAT family N-acetyltransferase [Streptomyces sp. 796.1]|uniref:GNAT family N-acetyltransferase n=1 Tax=Streptomyces sp. 796.1 TaxID=3163029 RepID=UPI0039C981DC
MRGVELTTTDIAPTDAAMATDVAPLIRTLRPGLTEDAFTTFATRAHAQGLVFTAGYDPVGTCLAVATHRVLATSRGLLLYVDDLVTAEHARSGGVGARMFAVLEARARAAGCTRIELDSGVTNHHAHRFYHAHRMAITALHFGQAL